jgi:hypothetical protein
MPQFSGDHPDLPGLVATLGATTVAALVGVRAESVAELLAGQRTDDPALARATWLAGVVHQLRGAYTDTGIARWFDRPRLALGHRSPRHALTGAWTPEDDGPVRVLALASGAEDAMAT